MFLTLSALEQQTAAALSDGRQHERDKKRNQKKVKKKIPPKKNPFVVVSR